MARDSGWSWTVLGAGSILPRAGYGSAGHALRGPGTLEHQGAGSVTLLDCGPGTLRSLGNAGIGVEEIERVFVSHFHPDHWLDLLALAFARRNPALALAPDLEIVGPSGLAGLLERAGDVLGSRSWLRFERTEVIEIDPTLSGGSLERGSAVWRWTATKHTPESVSWRVDLPGGVSAAYTGDTPETPEVADLAAGVSLFVCECSFADSEAVPGHLTPTSAGRLAERAGCACLLLTHFYPGLDPEAARVAAAIPFGGRIEISRDGSVHGIEDPTRPRSARSGAGDGFSI
jgi:ribonuclease BN (tRNA processing enzyme)